MSDFITIDSTGIPELQEKLRLLGPEGAKEITDDVTQYFYHLMQESEPPKNYVTRTAAYGKPFQTDKQRRYFFAALRDGRITSPYKRTGAMQAGWKIINRGPYNSVLYNNTPGAGWVYGENQAMQLLMVGWRQLKKTIEGEGRRVQQIADIAIRKVIKRLGL